MKTVRISIEWDYGFTATLFKYLCNTAKLKLLQNNEKVSKVYTVATLLRNMYIALYGCQTSNYFNFTIPPDMLESGKNFLTDGVSIAVHANMPTIAKKNPSSIQWLRVMTAPAECRRRVHEWQRWLSRPDRGRRRAH